MTVSATPRPAEGGPTAVSDAQLKAAAAFIEEEEGAVSRFRGWLGYLTTFLLVAMSAFHLYAVVEIVLAQVLRPVRRLRPAARLLCSPLAPRYRNRLMWWDVVCAALGVATIVYLLRAATIRDRT